MVIVPGMVEAVADRRRAARRCRRSRPARSPRRATRRCRAAAAPSADVCRAPQRIDLGQGKSRDDPSTASASTSLADRPGRSIVANSTPSRSSSCSRGRPVLLQEAFERLLRRAGARALDLLADRLGLPAAVRARSAPAAAASRRSRSPRSPARRAASSSANSRARSLRARACIRAGISSRQQLEQEVGSRRVALARPSTPRRRPWPGRGRGRYRPGARRPRSRRAPAAC